MTSDLSKCINCSRCVRACDEVQGQFVLSMHGRGFDARIIKGLDTSFEDSPCVSCGACAQACPTSAISDVFQSKSIEATKKTRTDLHLLRRRLQSGGRHEGQRGPLHPGAGRCRGEPRPHLPEGPLRLQVLQSPGPPAQAAHPQQRPLRGGDLGRGLRPHRRRTSRASRPSTAAMRSAAFPRRAARTRKTTSCRNSSASVFGTNNIDCCARVCHSPDGLGHAEGLRHRRGHQLRRSTCSTRTASWSSARTRPRAIRSPARRSSSAP